MRPRTSSGDLGYSGGLCGPPWVPKGGLFGVRVSSSHTHRAEGGCYIGRGAVTCDQKIFSCGFLCCTIHNMSGPNHKPLKTTCHRLRKPWDENTLLNKRPHKIKAKAKGTLSVRLKFSQTTVVTIDAYKP